MTDQFTNGPSDEQKGSERQSGEKLADQAIHDMVVATDFYHKALFERTTEFLLLEPSALGPILRAQALGGAVTREAGPVQGGSTVIAFITDPDGYKIELIQRAEGAAGGGLR